MVMIQRRSPIRIDSSIGNAPGGRAIAVNIRAAFSYRSQLGNLLPCQVTRTLARAAAALNSGGNAKLNP